MNAACGRITAGGVSRRQVSNTTNGAIVLLTCNHSQKTACADFLARAPQRDAPSWRQQNG